MKPLRFAVLIVVLAASMPAAADVYRWVDERGVTHYSDRRPADPDAADKVERVRGARVSVYSPDRTVVQAVEARRFRGIEPEGHSAATKASAAFDPCLSADCGVSGVLYPYPETVYVPFHRRAPRLVQAVLPPGAIAGTVNSPGVIPGNSGSVTPVIPQSSSSGPRMRPLNARPAFEPPSRR